MIAPYHYPCHCTQNKGVIRPQQVKAVEWSLHLRGATSVIVQVTRKVPESIWISPCLSVVLSLYLFPFFFVFFFSWWWVGGTRVIATVSFLLALASYHLTNFTSLTLRMYLVQWIH